MRKSPHALLATRWRTFVPFQTLSSHPFSLSQTLSLLFFRIFPLVSVLSCLLVPSLTHSYLDPLRLRTEMDWWPLCWHCAPRFLEFCFCFKIRIYINVSYKCIFVCACVCACVHICLTVQTVQDRLISYCWYYFHDFDQIQPTGTNRKDKIGRRRCNSIVDGLKKRKRKGTSFLLPIFRLSQISLFA